MNGSSLYGDHAAQVGLIITRIGNILLRIRAYKFT